MQFNLDNQIALGTTLGGAVLGLTHLSMGKMVYSSGASLFAAKSYMKENGITGGDLVTSTITGQKSLLKK